MILHVNSHRVNQTTTQNRHARTFKTFFACSYLIERRKKNEELTMM